MVDKRMLFFINVLLRFPGLAPDPCHQACLVDQHLAPDAPCYHFPCVVVHRTHGAACYLCSLLNCKGARCAA